MLSIYLVCGDYGDDAARNKGNVIRRPFLSLPKEEGQNQSYFWIRGRIGSSLTRMSRIIQENMVRILYRQNIHYIMKFEEACLWGLPDFEHQDNSICRDSYNTALLAVGGVLKAIDAVQALPEVVGDIRRIRVEHLLDD